MPCISIQVLELYSHALLFGVGGPFLFISLVVRDGLARLNSFCVNVLSRRSLQGGLFKLKVEEGKDVLQLIFAGKEHEIPMPLFT